jgi:hypothetical protein
MADRKRSRSSFLFMPPPQPGCEGGLEVQNRFLKFALEANCSIATHGEQLLMLHATGIALSISNRDDRIECCTTVAAVTKRLRALKRAVGFLQN